MTREEQLDALLRSTLEKLCELPGEVDRRRGGSRVYGPIYELESWLRDEFLRTQAP